MGIFPTALPLPTGATTYYDNSTSGLSATTVQGAIDEVDQNLDDHIADTTAAHAASAISYDNTSSLLTATDAQAAIDEVEGRVDTLETDKYDKSGGTISGDVTITGGLIVNGTTTTVNSTTVQVADNLMLLNYGEPGAGVTAGTSGLQVDRGSLTDYLMIFDEATDTFRAGEVGSTQALATREDAPSAGGVAVWNDTAKRFDTDTDLPKLDAALVTSVTFESDGSITIVVP